MVKWLRCAVILDLLVRLRVLLFLVLLFSFFFDIAGCHVTDDTIATMIQLSQNNHHGITVGHELDHSGKWPLKSHIKTLVGRF